MKEEIFKRIDALASKLGVTASYLWQVLIKEARIEAIRDCVILVVGTIVLYLMYRLFQWGLKQDDGEFPCTAAVILIIITMIVMVVAAYSLPMELFNPEYWALKEIMGVIK